MEVAVAIEPVAKAVLAGDAGTRAGLAQLISATTVNTVYTAYAFYQDRKGGPLTVEEMEEIKSKVASETMEFAAMTMNHLGNMFSDYLNALD